MKCTTITLQLQRSERMATEVDHIKCEVGVLQLYLTIFNTSNPVICTFKIINRITVI